ncbi:hypothetical protein KFE25_014148 [Diacronema lutheri]|uniref:Uncharacterized protein n=2 Tax=Diacronema lutheri TaxID=2081491 RepID=A0A8J5X4P0_DIALT|nr:hypothetical protein KFE25_014148 [Diacronema lutheri]
MGAVCSGAKAQADEEAARPVLPEAAPQSAEAATAAAPYKPGPLAPSATPATALADKHEALQARVSTRNMSAFARTMRGVRKPARTVLGAVPKLPHDAAPAADEPGLSPHTIVLSYTVALGALALALALSVVQLTIDFELAQGWTKAVCTVAGPVALGKMARGHGGLACARVPILPPGVGVDPIDVPINADTSVEVFPKMEVLRWHAQHLVEQYPPGTTTTCWLSASGRYIRLSPNLSYREAHGGCPAGWDMRGAPYVLAAAIAGVMWLLGFTSLDELRLAWFEGGYERYFEVGTSRVATFFKQWIHEIALALGYVPPERSTRSPAGGAGRAAGRGATQALDGAAAYAAAAKPKPAPVPAAEPSIFARMAAMAGGMHESSDFVPAEKYSLDELSKYRPPLELEDEEPSIFKQGSVRTRQLPQV